MSKQLSQRALGNLMKLTDCAGPEEYGAIFDEIEGDLRAAIADADAIDTSPERVRNSAENVHEPVGVIGKVVMFGGDLKEVSWTRGKMPRAGSVLYTAPPDTEALRKELEQQRTEAKNWKRWCEESEAKAQTELELVKGERDSLLIACKRALNYAKNVGEAEGVLFDNDGDIPAIEAVIAARGEDHE